MRTPEFEPHKGLLEPVIRHLVRQVGVRRNLSFAVRVRSSAVSMADARRDRAECRDALATRVAQTAPVGGPPHRSMSPAANAATGPAGNEQQASSLHPSVRREGRTTTPSLTPASIQALVRCRGQGGGDEEQGDTGALARLRSNTEENDSALKLFCEF